MDRDDLWLKRGQVYKCDSGVSICPTLKAPPPINAKFVSEVQDGIHKVPPGDILVLIGDFNARVGKRKTQKEMCVERFKVDMGSVVAVKLERNFGVLCHR